MNTGQEMDTKKKRSGAVFREKGKLNSFLEEEAQNHVNKLGGRGKGAKNVLLPTRSRVLRKGEKSHDNSSHS